MYSIEQCYNTNNVEDTGLFTQCQESTKDWEDAQKTLCSRCQAKTNSHIQSSVANGQTPTAFFVLAENSRAEVRAWLSVGASDQKH